MFGAFKYRTKNEPRQRAQLPFRQRMPAARGFMPLPAPMTRQPQGFGGGLGGLLRFLRPQIFRQPQRRGGLFGGLGSIFMPRRTPDFNPNVRRGGFLGGLGGLFGGRMGGFGGLFGRRFAEGGEASVDIVKNFMNSPLNYSGQRAVDFVQGNPRLTKLLRTLIVARRIGDRGEMNPKFAQSYKNVLQEANDIGLRQLAFGFDHFGARELYNNPFEQSNNINNNMTGVVQRAEGGEVDAVPMQQGGDPYAASIVRSETGMDPITRQLLFGLDGKGGFIPGAFRAAEKTFFDEEGKARVVPEEVAGFSADQLRAQELARQAVGTQDPFLQQARAAYQTGIADLDRGLTEQADILRTTAGAYDPSMTQRFMDPYEQAVVDQTSQDLIEQFAKSDIGSRAQDIARGGASAFGSRGKLGAAERTRALGRGLAEAIGGIRSRGFQQAQSTGLGEFARQQAAQRALAGGLGSIGAARQAGQFGLASALTGLGTQAAGARAGDIGMLSNLGLSQQQLAQQQLDAQRRNLLTAQQAPLAQFSALRPFVGMAPQGQFQTQTTFTPPPSPLQAGLATGLGAFGALGNFFNQGQPQQYPGLPSQFQG